MGKALRIDKCLHQFNAMSVALVPIPVQKAEDADDSIDGHRTWLYRRMGSEFREKWRDFTGAPSP